METWKVVSGSYGPYEVSSEGRVRRRGRALIPRITANGYAQVAMYSCPNKVTHILVHRLVAASFIGEIADELQVNHKNGIRADNRVENLEIVTASENAFHSYRELGRDRKQGERHHSCKLSNDEVLRIRERHLFGARQVDSARQFGIDKTSVRDIVNRATWTHI